MSDPGVTVDIYSAAASSITTYKVRRAILRFVNYIDLFFVGSRTWYVPKMCQLLCEANQHIL